MIENKVKTTQEKAGRPNKPDFFSVVEKMLDKLPGKKRGKDILLKRYGLSGDFKEQTLEQVGRDYGVTRERVRQIISDLKKALARKCLNDDFFSAEKRLLFTIEKNHGIVKEVAAISRLNKVGSKQEENAIRFLLEYSKNIKLVWEKDFLEKSWVSQEETMEKVREILLEGEAVFGEKKRVLSNQEIVDEIVGRKKGFVVKEEVISFLETSLRIRKNGFGKWGIHDWPEIKPKGSREKIYLILKESKRPLHFKEISKLIDAHGLSKKKAHPQTIHNELIKDARFVLIGRGIYALSEWGYYQGTIKDVLVNILEKKGPLHKEIILEEVFRIRRVKKTTIMINLNNSKLFSRDGDHYAIKR